MNSASSLSIPFEKLYVQSPYYGERLIEDIPTVTAVNSTQGTTAGTAMAYATQSSTDLMMAEIASGLGLNAESTGLGPETDGGAMNLYFKGCPPLAGLEACEFYSCYEQQTAVSPMRMPMQRTTPMITDGAGGADMTKTTSSKYPTKEDWTEHRDIITRLYAKTTLPKAMRHMEQEHHFVAT